MGKVKDAATKVALGVAGVVGTAAAIGAAAKKEYSETKAAKKAEAESKVKHADEIYAENRAREREKREAIDRQKEEIRKQRQNENRIYELSKTPQLEKSGLGGAIFLYILLAIPYTCIICSVSKEALENSTIFWLCLFGNLFIALIFFLIRNAKFRRRIKGTQGKIGNLKHKLAFLRKEKENNNDSLYADLTNEIIIHQSALNNVAIKYNKYIKKFPNVVHAKMYAIEPIDPSDKEEIITLKWTSK